MSEEKYEPGCLMFDSYFYVFGGLDGKNIERHNMILGSDF